MVTLMESLVQQLKISALATLLVAIGTPISHADPLIAVPGLAENFVAFKAASPVVRPKPKQQTISAQNPVDNEALQLGLLPLNNQAQIPPAPVTFTPAPAVPVTPTPAIPVPVSSPVAAQPPPQVLVQQPPLAVPQIPSTAPQVFTPLPVARPGIPSDSQTEAAIQSPTKCPYADGRCYKGTRASGLTEQSADIKKIAEAQNGDADSDLQSKLAAIAVREAVKGRSVANFCGGGYRSGNKSKCACAAGVKDALLSSGICTSRPPGDAINLAGFRYNGTTSQLSRTGPDSSHALTAFCPALHQSHGREPNYSSSITAASRAPAGSVIVYSTSRHKWGHIEIKIKVTAQNIREISHNLRVKVGDYLYCSDFCRAGPTLSHGTNRVEAIYSL